MGLLFYKNKNTSLLRQKKQNFIDTQREMLSCELQVVSCYFKKINLRVAS